MQSLKVEERRKNVTGSKKNAPVTHDRSLICHRRRLTDAA
jgi:hypothetical protein